MAKPAPSPARSRPERWKQRICTFYSENPEHDLKGGLLLRRDLHALFDRWLITIDPDTSSILIAPELTLYSDLAKLDGRPVLLSPDLWPRSEYVRNHAAIARTA